MRKPSSSIASVLVTRIVALAALVFVAAPTRALAACNDPPDPKKPANLMDQQKSATTMALQLNGSVGSIDSPFLVPGKEDGSGAPRTATVHGLGITKDDVVGIGVAGSGEVVILATSCNLPKCPPGSNDIICHPTTLSIDIAAQTVVFDVEEYKVQNKALAGAARVAVGAASDMCRLADMVCAPGALHACIDKLTYPAPPPPAQPVPLERQFPSLTLLPVPNDAKNLCNGNSCNGSVNELNITLDSSGDILVPMYWGKIIRNHNTNADCAEKDKKNCEKRWIRAETTLAAYPGLTTNSAVPLLPDEYLQSFNKDGESFDPPPTFTANTAVAHTLALQGTVDEALSVLRIRRCTQTDLDPNGVCSNGLFDLASRAGNGLEFTVGRKSQDHGFCQSTSNGDCTKDNDKLCQGAPCMYFKLESGDIQLSGGGGGGGAGGGGNGGGGDFGCWFLLIAVLGLLWLWVRERGRNQA
ncbi:MAG TPA: hypothetical protein VGK20_13725 [Candidatus Binatia bacterium]|jgi:hypothetical protein